MALSDFTKDITEVISRGGGVFVTDDNGTTYYDLGRVKNVEVNWEPVTTDPDTAGRPKQLAADITFSWVMTQTDTDQLSNLNLLHESGTNGIWVKFTSVFTDTTGAGAAAGFEVKNALVVMTGQISFNQDESMISCECSGRIPMSELIKLGTLSEITFDGASA